MKTTKMKVKIMLLIECNPKILGKKPVIKGTRIGVDLILERLSFGEAKELILEAYPHHSQDAVQAALIYAT